MAKTPKPPDPPNRIPPADALPDVVERLVSRRQVQLEDGDVVITRERVPLVNSSPLYPVPWRYRVTVRGTDMDPHTYNSFQHAASEAEQLASQRKARIVYVEDNTPNVLGDYRR